jgi:predicted lipoprotein with Yx(FWY)xxD motif
MRRRHAGMAVISALAVMSAACSAAVATWAPAATPPGGTVISEVTGPFGPMLIAGSGRYKGYSLYAITSDYARHFGCTTMVRMVLGHRSSCTGPSGDPTAEWPAITTVGRPVAGHGVNPKLLGSVVRANVGRQVVYAGHPLYLFDNGAFEVTGQGWDEPMLPPWHGVWWLVAPSGAYQPWPAMLTWTWVGGRQVLAALMDTTIGFKPFPVYTFTRDSGGLSRCYGKCAAAWPPVLTSGPPGIAGDFITSHFGVVKRSDGTWQATYRGKPLYLFWGERMVFTRKGYAATGNGNGVVGDGGKWHLVRR